MVIVQAEKHPAATLGSDFVTCDRLIGRLVCFHTPER